jgi:hypothetical protein
VLVPSPFYSKGSRFCSLHSRTPSRSRVAPGSRRGARAELARRLDAESLNLLDGRPASGTVGGKAGLATPDGSGRSAGSASTRRALRS